MMSADLMYSQHYQPVPAQNTLQQPYHQQQQQQQQQPQQQRPAAGQAQGQHELQQHQQQPCGAGFGFDGKLVQYFNVKPDVGIGGLPYQRLVTISKVVTEPEFVARSERLDYALESGNLGDFCREKSEEALDPSPAKVWEFLQASFSPTPSQAYLSIMGYESSEMFSKLHNIMESRKDVSDSMTDGFVTLTRGVPDGYISNQSSQNGDIESDSHVHSHEEGDKELIDIPTDESTEGLINQALLSGNTEVAVDLCLQHSRWEDALILASTGSQELIKKTQLKYFQKRAHETSNMIVAVVTRDLRRVVEHCDLKCWKEALATALTYSDPLGFPYLAETLGRRLGSSEDESLRKNALLCYICCGHINHLVDSWASAAVERADESGKPEHLQDAVEQLLVLKKVGELHGRDYFELDRILGEKLVKYGSLLVSQGSLKTALKYISDSTDPAIVDLKQRVEYVLGTSRPAPAPSALPVQTARSRQPSESSKYSLTKRPSYPMPGQMSPALGSTYDSRRMSGYADGPNISSLTGPPVPPVQQAVDAMGFYNPLNVNTTMTTPAYGQHQQMTPIGGGSTNLPSGGASYYGGGGYANPERRPSATSLPPPMISNVPHGWNDPPPLKPKSTAVVPKTPAVEAITHPIFGSAAPEPQTMYSPYGGGAAPAPGLLMGYNASSTPMGPPPTGRKGPTPQAACSYGAPPVMQSSSYGAPPVMQSSSYGAPPVMRSSSYGAPPVMHSSSYGAPPVMQPSSYGAPPVMQASSYGAPPVMPSSSYGAPPVMQSSSYGAPPVMHSSSYGAPPVMPSSSYGAPPVMQSRSYGAPPFMPMPPPVSTPHEAPPFMPMPPPVSTPHEAPPLMSIPPPVSTPHEAPPVMPMPPPVSTPHEAPPVKPMAPPVSTPHEGPPVKPMPPPVSTPHEGPPFMPMPPPVSTPHEAPPFMPMPPPVSTPHEGPPSRLPSVSNLHGAPPPTARNQSRLPQTPPPLPPTNQKLEPQQPSNSLEVPAEHAQLIKVLEDLRSVCYNHAHQVPVKRKLEDIAKKLEILAEKLRDGSLSAKTLSSLHNMAEALEKKDYQLGLGIHTQLVTSGSFSEISSFLPAIKALIQTAAQLGV